jgi:hypothetical protein
VARVPGASAFAISPNGKTAYVIGFAIPYHLNATAIWAVNLVSGAVGRQIRSPAVDPLALLGERAPRGFKGGTQSPNSYVNIAVGPGGLAYATTAYGFIYPVGLATGKRYPAIAMLPDSLAIAVTPDGKTAFVTCLSLEPSEPGQRLVAINLETHEVGRSIFLPKDTGDGLSLVLGR